MCRNRVIQLRVTEDQHRRILLKMQYLGYKTLSQFVRDLLLKEDLATFKMIQDIHKKVVGGKIDKKSCGN